MLELDLNKVINKIKRENYKKVLIQVPEGLKTKVVKIAEEIERETKARVFISAEPCYGSCDLPLEEASVLKVDAIVHIGHSDFGVKTKIPVFYVPVYFDLKIPERLKKEISKIKEKKLSIYSSEPFRKVLDDLEKFLLKVGKEVIEKKIILGCSEIEQKGEANVFVGSGKFHPLALHGKTYFLNLEKNKLEDMTEEIEREEMKKQARISKFKEAKKIGILISTKPGQFYKDYEKIKEKLEKEGKEAEIVIMDEIKNEKLIDLDFDAYLNTACPRILDNHFDKLIVNLKDLF
ncbi:MAG: diphthamide biosynthesis enzyme Dph2 [Candidatus Aenigmatarchaeota archaeon]|nr:MAG: diphthamide biosynthesis enzyme Dph2 [Candidatus Aenigmarchaeota archaeon]